MRRLYLRIYLAVLASLLAFALLLGLVWYVAQRGVERPQWTGLLAQAAAELLPADAPVASLQQSLERWHLRSGASLLLATPAGVPLASAGDALTMPDDAERTGWRRGPDRVPVFVLSLPDGRRLAIGRLPMAEVFGRPPRPGFLSVLLLIGAAIGVGAYPVVRRLTRRLEDLQGAVERFGNGELGARAPVEGRDEVAALAARFNRSAQRISALLESQRALLDAHKRLLANASHELRSPLARIRMAAELIGPAAPSEIRDELARNVAELDQLVDEILLASRLDAAGAPLQPSTEGTQLQPSADCMRPQPSADGMQPRPSSDGGQHAAGGFAANAIGLRAEPVDLTAVVAEECARFPVAFEAPVFVVDGDARLLARLVRNLLENARRHAGGAGVVVLLSAVQDRPAARPAVRLEVCDRGPGVPEQERSRIFEPFHRASGASEQQGGVGLGLALVRQIARLHGGDAVCLEGPDGVGSCFRVELPLPSAAAGGHPGGAAASDPPPSGRG